MQAASARICATNVMFEGSCVPNLAVDLVATNAKGRRCQRVFHRESIYERAEKHYLASSTPYVHRGARIWPLCGQRRTTHWQLAQLERHRYFLLCTVHDDILGYVEANR